MKMQEPTEAELERAEQVWRDLQSLTSRRAAWELALLCRKLEGSAFEHGVIEGRRYPTGLVANPYNGELAGGRRDVPEQPNTSIGVFSPESSLEAFGRRC